MQQHPRWQYNQWTNVPLQQQHRGPRPLMQMNLGGQHESFYPYNRQAEYNMNPNRAPGMGWGHRQVPYYPNNQMNMMQSFPPNMRNNVVQRNIPGINHYNKPPWDNKMLRPPNTTTKYKNRSNDTAKENYPEHMAYIKEAKSADTLSKIEKDVIVPSIKECPVNSTSRKEAKNIDTLSKIEKDVIFPSIKECPVNSTSRKEAKDIDTLSKIEKNVIVPSIKECPMNSTSRKEAKSLDTLSKIEKDLIVPSIKECPVNSTSRKEAKDIDNLSKIEKDVIVPSIKECPVNSTSRKEAKTIDTLSKIEKDLIVPPVKECLVNSTYREEAKTTLSILEKDLIVPSIIIKKCPVNSTSNSHDVSGISYRIINSNVKKVHLDEEVYSNIDDFEDKDISCINVSSSSENKSEDDDYTGVINEEKTTSNDEAEDIIQNQYDHIAKKSGIINKPFNSSKRKLERDIEDHIPIKKIKAYNEPHSNDVNGNPTCISEDHPNITQEKVTDYCPNGHSLRKCYSTVNVITNVISVFCKRCKIMIHMG